MNDAQVRALISEMRATHSKTDGNADAYRLALIAEELMLQRDRRSEDWYSSNRTIADREARLAKVRAEVAEEIAQAIEALGEGAVYTKQAAQVAREHGKEN